MKKFLKDIIIQAGQRAKDLRGKAGGLAIDRKSKRDLVTEADKAVEKFLIEGIRREFPSHGIFAEETGRHDGDEFQWIIDPIDGTTSYIHGHPFYSVSVALQQKGRSILAAVYAPSLDELFEAQLGKGATLNNQPIRVSNESDLEDSLLATGFACMRDNHTYNNLPYFTQILPRIRDVRRTGSAAVDLSYIACGRLEGFWELNLKLYDIAAGALILSEAGGKVTDFTGRQNGLPAELIATNGHIHDKMIAILRRVKAEIFSDKSHSKG